ncbi:mechanosensitive ion channel family protein [bacterium]|nr:mechanosensitive ion channel family protein [bacterium]
MFDWIGQYLSTDWVGIGIRLAVIIVIGIPGVFLLSKWLRGYISKKHSPQHGLIVGKIVLYSGLIIILFSLLNELGFKLTHLVAAAGVTGVIVGFAAQTSVSNIISGFFLIAERPFIVGDAITVGSTTGEVLSIDMLSIKLRTFENKFVRMPNETILKSEVTNITHFPIRRVDYQLGSLTRKISDKCARFYSILLITTPFACRSLSQKLGLATSVHRPST